MRTRDLVLCAMVILVAGAMLCGPAWQAAEAAQGETLGADDAGQSLFNPDLDPFEAAAGWCEWTCSDGTSGSGPAPNAEACQEMCEISCDEPCVIIEN